MLKFLIAATVALSFAACSFDKDGNANATKAQQDNQKAIEEFKDVKGSYAGTMIMGGITYSVTLNLDIKEQKSDKKDDNGQPIYEVVRMANLKRISPAASEYSFNVGLSRELGKVSLVNVDSGSSNPNKPALTRDDIDTIDAKYVTKQRITGRLLNNTAVKIGEIDVVWQATESGNQGSQGNQEQEYYDNLRKEYETLVGTYVGNSVKDGKAQEYELTIKLRPQPVGITSAPELYGTLFRTDDKLRSAGLSLSFIYQNNSNPKRLFITGKPMDFNRVDYIASFDGVMQNNAYIGTWSTQHRGFEGSFEFVRKGEVQPTPTPTATPKPDESTCSMRGKFPCLPETVPTPIPRPK
jgi:hypothetical protein